MITPLDLSGAMARNLGTIKNQTKDLSHADSVLQPPVKGNCMNWVLGHIVENRSNMLKLLGQPAILTDAQAKRYGYGSEPVCGDGDDVIKLDTLLALLEQSQQAIEAVLAKITPEELGKEMKAFYGDTTLGQFLFFLYWHETYHVGQTELLREVALAAK